MCELDGDYEGETARGYTGENKKSIIKVRLICYSCLHVSFHYVNRCDPRSGQLLTGPCGAILDGEVGQEKTKDQHALRVQISLLLLHSIQYY